MIRSAVIALLLLGPVACKSQDPPKPTDCAKVIPPGIDLAMAAYKDDPRVKAVIDKAKTEMVAICTNDKWPGFVGACIAKAKNAAALDGCRGGLERDQMVHLNEVNARLRGAIEQSGAKAPAVGSGSAGSGSD